MTATTSRMLWIALLTALLFFLQLQPVDAAMVATDQAMAVEQQGINRSKVLALAGREDVKKRLEAMGVAPELAKARIAALSDSEIASLAGKLDGQPAGGNLGQTDIIIILLIAILVAIAV